MEDFTGFKTTAVKELPTAVPVMDPFHVVRLAGDGLDLSGNASSRPPSATRGRSGGPLYGIRRTLHTSTDLLTDKQTIRLKAVFGRDEHVEVEATWGIYQRIITTYREPDRGAGKKDLQAVIRSRTIEVPPELTELITLGRTLTRKATDVLAYFDRPGISNTPAEAINGRLKHRCGTALGLRNLAHYTTRALLDTEGGSVR